MAITMTIAMIKKMNTMDDNDDNVPVELERVEVQFPGWVARVPDWEFLAPKRKRCCSLQLKSGYLKKIKITCIIQIMVEHHLSPLSWHVLILKHTVSQLKDYHLEISHHCHEIFQILPCKTYTLKNQR